MECNKEVKMDKVDERSVQEIFTAGGVLVTVVSELTRDGDGELCVSIKLTTNAPVRLAVDANESSTEVGPVIKDVPCPDCGGARRVNITTYIPHSSKCPAEV
jgi:hypothetical protein